MRPVSIRDKQISYEQVKDHYDVDREGNIYSLNYNSTGKRGLLKPQRVMNYLQVKLGRFGPIYVHRMVAGKYLPMPEGKEFVNHIDGNTYNNHVDNLEWVTEAENQRRAWRKKGMKRLTPNERTEIFKLYKKGLTVEKIAKIFDRPMATIYQFLRRSGVNFPPPGRPFYLDVDEELTLDLYSKGVKLREMEDILGCSVSTIHTILKDNGIRKNRKHRLSEDQVREVLKRVKDGVKPKKILEEFDIRYNTFYCIKAGITYKHIERD